MGKKQIKIHIKDLWFYYHGRSILENINIEIEKNVITSIVGPSGQGKSSFLMTLNRLWESVDGATATGTVEIDFGNGFQDIYHKKYSLSLLRRQVGMVFQVPNPLPMTIYKNIAFPLKLMGEKDQDQISAKVEEALKRSFLWEEVKDRLCQDARTLSGGQQQRLCIARAMVLEPQVLLLDEPTSSLDETSVRVIEQLLLELKSRCTIILVSHYMDQVKRIADNKLVLSDRQFKQQ
ncbi:phosphate ABC transporter ATP-binding protein [Desulfobacula phenolica]|uniref:Phosphate ABC transporter ATP-binding protein, PhoT family n=1 Tax=Desulfobacula phenolica TaxID=90732 RepID=A0A1H2FB45_9BACT|nr:phosphate ABC transporter ATP-binding protein [Desulfobacula phenolica]SDU04483.1 phosphate ABC transporter ATP-binding protein, PhoT family [Desulfobacula phenolica]